jgi:hypothetical protein
MNLVSENPASVLRERNRESSTSDTVSGNRTSLFVIEDRYLIVHVLLIIVCRGDLFPIPKRNVQLTVNGFGCDWHICDFQQR